MSSMPFPFQTFWKTYFPEQRELSREEALAQIETGERFASMKAMRDYQDNVAPVYGAYELEAFQLATMEKLLPVLLSLPASRRETLLSLGSGPGSYELWLLSQGYVRHVTLVDLSEAMLARAGEIARHLGIGAQVRMLCGDAATVEVEVEVEVCLCINALHWSVEWRAWVRRMIRATRAGGLLFLSASLFFPRSEITQKQLVGVAARGCTIREQGFLLPGMVTGDQLARSTRYVVIGERLKETRR